MPFQKATKAEAKLRLALIGVAKAGKTYTALNVAKFLVPGGRTALIDTEHGSASKLADIFDFDTEILDSFKAERYIMAMTEAALAGYDVVIVDSLSHAWAGKGGLLEFKDRLVDADAKHDGFRAWAKVTPIQNELIDTILGLPCHVICTIRVKQDYVYEPNDKGKLEVVKNGLAPVQREGMEYEFDVIARLNQKQELEITETRCTALLNYQVHHAGKELAETLRSWLTEGKTPFIPNYEATQKAFRLAGKQRLIDELVPDVIPTIGQLPAAISAATGLQEYDPLRHNEIRDAILVRVQTERQGVA